MDYDYNCVETAKSIWETLYLQIIPFLRAGSLSTLLLLTYQKNGEGLLIVNNYFGNTLGEVFNYKSVEFSKMKKSCAREHSFCQLKNHFPEVPLAIFFDDHGRGTVMV